ncbi:TRAP transporter small permease [Microbaculum marinum]|uniref:TRAP transporter small permease protein n=1 Tax=Microbaculum marinum TaxID=1764581 RepID=A0AAW9S1F5_9HYPH
MSKDRRPAFIAFDRGLADIAGAALVVMMVMTAISSFGRFFFSMPVPDVEAIAEMLLVGVVFLPLAYTQAKREHVVVTLFTDHMRAGIRARLIWFGVVVGIAGFAILLYALSKGALRAYESGDAYLGVNQIVTWPARTLAVVGTAALIVRLALDLTVSRTRAAELEKDGSAEIENTS